MVVDAIMQWMPHAAADLSLFVAQYKRAGDSAGEPKPDGRRWSGWLALSACHGFVAALAGSASPSRVLWKRRYRFSPYVLRKTDRALPGVQSVR